MAKDKISQWSSVPANNTDVGGINIGEGMLPSDVNNAMREMMAQIKDQQAGLDGDNFTVGGNLVVNGSSTFSGDISLNNLTTTGNTTLGNAAGDTLTVNGSTASIPNELGFDNAVAVTRSNFSITGSISATTLTVTALGTGTIRVGYVISGTGVTDGTTIVAVVSAWNGTTGTYTVSTSQSVSSTTITGTTTDASFEVNSTDAVKLPRGTTAQRPAAQEGIIRANSDLNRFEGYINGAWGSIGGGATGGGADTVFIENSLTVTTSYSIPAGKSAMSTGDITVDGGVTITVPSGSRWVII
jgi:hypothetical protein